MPDTFLSVPRYIFLHNGRADECKVVAQALTDYLPNPIIESFLEPVKGMIVGAYYETEPYEGYIAFDKPEDKCRNSGYRLIDLIKAYKSKLEELESWEILGILALSRCESAGDLFSNFIFFDADHGMEILPFARKYPDQCLIVLAPGMVVPPRIDGPVDVMWAQPHETILKLKARQEEETAP